MTQSNSSSLFTAIFRKVRTDHISGSDRIKAALAMTNNDVKTVEKMVEWLHANKGTSEEELSSECLAMSIVLQESAFGHELVLCLFSRMQKNDKETLLELAIKLEDNVLVTSLEEKGVALSHGALLLTMSVASHSVFAQALDRAYEIDQIAMIIAAVSARDQHFETLINHPRINLSAGNNLLFRLLIDTDQSERFDLAIVAMAKKTAIKTKSKPTSETEPNPEFWSKLASGPGSQEIINARLAVKLVENFLAENGKIMGAANIHEIIRILSDGSK
jgi:hypothetical protein